MADHEKPTQRRRRTGRLARTVRSLVIIIAIGMGLALFNLYSNTRDVRIATGPPDAAQRAFFVASAERPDIPLFFKSLSPAQRITMAQRLGQHPHPKVVELVGKCLGTFDADARKALTDSLASLARTHPGDVAKLLSVPGSFQQLAIATALRSVGPDVLPAVAAQLSEGPARPNAVAYLVATGPAAIPPLLALLDSDKPEVRSAAADALGKLGAREAVPQLRTMYGKSTGDERLAAMTALAGIGDPTTEPLMTQALSDEALSVPQRTQAALGLGRIGTPTAVATLWKYAQDPDTQLREGAMSALPLASDNALRSPSALPEKLVSVAAGVSTPFADQLIARSLQIPAAQLDAARAAAGRPSLVPALLTAVRASAEDGEVADAMLESLASTPAGIRQIEGLRNDPSLGGLAERRLRLHRLTG